MRLNTSGRRTGPAGGDDGFTLAEVVVAIGILFVLMLGLVYGTTAGFLDISVARERQSASGLANQLLEKVRGLAYQKVAFGLSTTDLSGDANIVSCSGVWRFGSCSGEEIVATPSLPSTDPLVPHTGAYGPPAYPLTYTWSVYITRPAGAPAAGGYRATAIVSWPRAARNGVASAVRADTILYSPTGCTDPATHPYSTPCEPFFYSTPTVPQASAVITGLVQGLTFQSASLHGSASKSNAQLEQVGRVNGRTQAASIELVLPGNTQSAGGAVADSTADDDPATGASTYQTTTLPGGVAQSLPETSGANSLTLSLAAGDAGSSTSAMAAGVSFPCPPGPNPPTKIDGKPCGYSTSTAQATLSAALNVSAGGIPVSATLTALQDDGVTPGSAFIDRQTQSGADGRVQVTTSRAIGQLELLNVPSAILGLPLWGGYLVRLSGYADLAVATAGTNSTAPAAVVASGTVSYWNGLGYSTLNPGAVPVHVNVAPVTYAIPLTAVTIEMSANLDTGGANTSDTVSPTGSTTRTAAWAQAGPPLKGSLNYRVLLGSSEVANLTIALDLGSIVSTASYKPAPTS
jgi:type II secretory pathway pseudopilin PulG